jgi:hypothetical protein
MEFKNIYIVGSKCSVYYDMNVEAPEKNIFFVNLDNFDSNKIDFSQNSLFIVQSHIMRAPQNVYENFLKQISNCHKVVHLVNGIFLIKKMVNYFGTIFTNYFKQNEIFTFSYNDSVKYN